MKKIIIPCISLTLLAASTFADEVTYTKQIKPLFDDRCAACHGTNAAPEHKAFKMDKDKWLANGQGMRMDTYSHLIGYIGWPDTGAIMRRLDDGTNREDKKPGNMYEYLGDSDPERQANLALFKAWVGNWTLKRFDVLSKEDLVGIKVPY